MLNIHWYKGVVVLILFSVCGQFAWSQRPPKVIHQPGYSAKKVRFGYFLGVSSSRYKIKHNDFFLTQNQGNFFSVNSPVSYNLKMGGLINFNLNNRFDFRVLPTVAIYGRKLDINNDSAQAIPVRGKAWFEIPLMLKYKGIRRGNYRPYIFAGIRLGIETNAVNLARRNPSITAFSTKTSDFSLDYGAGIDFFQRFFKLSPEIQFSHGVANLVDNSALNTTNVLGVMDRLNTHTVTVFLFFE